MDFDPKTILSMPYFLASCSVSGLIVLLAALSLKEKNKPLDRVAFCSSVGSLTSDYIHGFLVSCNSARAINMKSEESSHTFINIIFEKSLVERALSENLAEQRRNGNNGLADYVDDIVEKMNAYAASL